ncbi:hypothetical protein V492_08344, partial [Pseudogymnoascus sp. VKM F-4246]
MSASEERAAP